MADYQFKYSPLTGRITGKQMLEQTEQAINALASQVDSAAGQVEIISTLANEANENAATALEVAEEALATTGRTYITVSGQADANIYYDSQLIYIADSTSTNIPVADTGMLEVKTNDNKTSCEQVFIADSSGDAYYRNGAITAETVGDVTTYTVTWGGWSSQPASQAYVQGELANYLPLSGGTVTGGLTVEGGIAGDLTGLASGNLPLSGGTMTGEIIRNGITVKSDADDSFTEYLGGTDETSSYLVLYGKNHATYPGVINIRAYDGVDSAYLTLKPKGEMTFKGKNVITKDNTRLTLQYVSNSVITSAQFNRNYAWISNGFLFLFINMNTTNGATTSDITTVGRIKDVNVIVECIDVVVEQNTVFKPFLICLYNNGSDVDIKVYCPSGAGGGRIGRTLIIPLP